LFKLEFSNKYIFYFIKNKANRLYKWLV